MRLEGGQRICTIYFLIVSCLILYSIDTDQQIKNLCRHCFSYYNILTHVYRAKENVEKFQRLTILVRTQKIEANQFIRPKRIIVWNQPSCELAFDPQELAFIESMITSVIKIWRKKLQIHFQSRSYLPIKIIFQLIKRYFKTMSHVVLKSIQIWKKVCKSRTFQPIENNQWKRTETIHSVFKRRRASLRGTGTEICC